jgi:cell division transport system permease protein
MIWLTHHLSALSLALERLRAAPFNALLSTLAIGIALALPAGGQLLISNGSQFARTATPAPELSIYLRLSADRAAADTVAQALRKLPNVREANFIDRDATLARFKGTEGLREVIEAIPRNPFPHAFVIHPVNESAQAMDELAATLRSWPQVEHVQLDSDWVRRLDALLKFGRSAVAVLGLLLGIGLIGITFNITRLQVLTRRDEIEVSQLIGATSSFVRRPFLYFGTLLGLGGGMFAWLIVQLGAWWLNAPLDEIAQLYELNVHFSGLNLFMSAKLLGFSGALGWVGTALSLSHHMRQNQTE